MDFAGQRLAEKIYYYLIILGGIIGFIAGFFAKDFQITAIIFGGGVLLSCLLCIPEWPFLNKHPHKWLKPVPPTEQQTPPPTPTPASTTPKKQRK